MHDPIFLSTDYVFLVKLSIMHCELAFEKKKFAAASFSFQTCFFSLRLPANCLTSDNRDSIVLAV